MKRILALLIFIFMLFPVMVYAGGCAGYGGECYSPPSPDSGYIGVPNWNWGSGYFAQIYAPVDINFDLAAATVDATGDIDELSAPNITTCDNIPCVVWDNSGETVGIQYTFRVPSGFTNTSFIVYALVSSDTASGTPALDWQMWVNANDVIFDAAAISQTAVASTQTTVNGTNDLLTLTMDSTGLAAMTAGTYVTLEFYNSNVHNSANTELKGLTAIAR